MSEKIEVLTDRIAEMLDDMSELSEIWGRNRQKGRESPIVRAAIVTLAQQITSAVDEAQREADSRIGEIDEQRLKRAERIAVANGLVAEGYQPTDNGKPAILPGGE